MEISIRPAHPTPPVMPDVRPAADAAAIVRDPRPEVPLPIPPGTASSGVAASAAIAEARPVAPVAETVRTLKPYGITMLPDEAAQRVAAERTRDAANAKTPEPATSAAAQQPAAKNPDVAARPELAERSAPGPTEALPDPMTKAV